MRTALDTNIVSSVWSQASAATEIVAQLLQLHSQGALVVSAPVFAELAAVPGFSAQKARKALNEMSISVDFDLGEDVWELAATTFAAYAIRRRRSGGDQPKRLLVDFVIAAHALLKADRLMTRDARKYALDFPSLRVI